MIKSNLVLTVVFFAFGLTACGDEPSNSAGSPTPPVTSQPQPAPAPPGASEASFVGVWAADPTWCANTSATGDRVPIRISATKFEGYENSCDILDVREDAGVFDADLRCQSEGVTSDQKVRMMVEGDALDLIYLSAGGGKVRLNRCRSVAAG